jgi:arginase
MKYSTETKESHMQRKPIRIHGIPMDLGQRRRGVDMGPSAIRYAGLCERLTALGWQVNDHGNIAVPDHQQLDTHTDIANAHNSAAVALVAHASFAAMQAAIRDNQIAIFLGGDHSCAIGTVAGAHTRPEPIGVIWVDAHADFNTPHTSPSGNVHGMVVSAAMGLCRAPLNIGTTFIQAHQIVMIAIRDLDPAERIALRTSGILVITMRDIDEQGMATMLRHALHHLRTASAIHVSFDMDALDPSIAPGVGTPVSGGLSIREAHLIMETLSDDGRVQSLDLVEVNPILDQYNHTASLAVDLTASLFGQRIL